VPIERQEQDAKGSICLENHHGRGKHIMAAGYKLTIGKKKGNMKRRTTRLLQIMLIFMMTALWSGPTFGGGWEITILGVNPKDLKNRSVPKMLLGAATSFVVHELGHLAYAQMHGGGYFDWDRKAIIWGNYHEYSDSRQQMFHRAGFLAQMLVGGALTALFYTRHSDFTFGFNGFSMINTALYSQTGGLGGDETGDIAQLKNGATEGGIYTDGFSFLVFQNLNNYEKWTKGFFEHAKPTSKSRWTGKSFFVTDEAVILLQGVNGLPE
jgi:hypothetical protein